MSITISTKTGKWVIHPSIPDRLGRVHDRGLRDLIDKLDTAIEAFDVFFATEAPRHAGGMIYNALTDAYEYLVDLRLAETQ